MSWIDDVMNSADGVLTKIGPDGKAIIIDVGKEAIKFVSQNSATIIRMGREGFITILYLIQDGRKIAAEEALIANMNAWELIEKMNTNADDVEKLAKLKDEWRMFIRDVFIKLSSTAVKGLIAFLI
ncbi:MAG: hypothetical protein Q8K86_08970 [Candidatus Nanopelagicaceae bacterium]|nr:hypothetical protein [Candidatus Nanopelagicaceae bacterium]